MKLMGPKVFKEDNREMVRCGNGCFFYMGEGKWVKFVFSQKIYYNISIKEFPV